MKKILSFVLSLAAFSCLEAQISIESVIPSNIPAGTSVDADVKINKGNIGNFAKYQMDVPVGYAVTAVDVQGGNFTFENQRAKIVWVSVPGDASFSVKFRIQGTPSATNQGQIVQKFFYLENNEKKEVEGTTVSLGGGSSDVASTTSSSSSASNTAPVETVKSSPVETVQSSTPVETVQSSTTNSTPVETVKSTPVETVHTEPVKTTPVATTTTKTSPSSTTSSAGTTYKVQLGAYATQPSKSKFAAAGNVSVDMVDGLYKVTTGSFKTKEEAMKHRDELQGKGFAGFIVTFQNGVRVK